MSNGIIYIAIGESHLKLALKSAQSIIAASQSQQNILILTNCDPCDFTFSHNITIKNIQVETNKLGSLSPSSLSACLKTKLYQYSPFDKTLYLDNDIRAVKPIDTIWEFADDWIGFAPAYNPIGLSDTYHVESEELATQQLLISENTSQYNSGMFLFGKASKTNSFFKLWFDEWSRFKYLDNKALTRILLMHKLSVNQIQSIYNQYHPNQTSDDILVHYIDWYKRFLD